MGGRTVARRRSLAVTVGLRDCSWVHIGLLLRSIILLTDMLIMTKLQLQLFANKLNNTKIMSLTHVVGKQ